jgi:hypothetical protein
MTFGVYLTRRLRWWESEAELKPSTLASYREAIELYSGRASGTSGWSTSAITISATCTRPCG